MMAQGLAITRRLDRLPEGRFAAVTFIPGLVLLMLVVLPPLIGGIGLGFFRVELLHDGFTPFIGLRNYATRMPADPDYLSTLPLTVAFATIVSAVSVPVALVAALLVVRSGRRMGGVIWLLLLLPWAVAPIATGIFWRILFDPSAGVLNEGLAALGLPAVVLREAPGSLVALALAVIWRAIPLLGVLFIGALRQVPRDLGRAARMDGASGWQAFRHVTLPAIAPSLVAACLLQMILTLQTFDVQFALASAGPPRGAELAGYHVYSQVIGEVSLGYGAAQAVVLGLIVAAFATGLIVAGRARSSRTGPTLEVPAAGGHPRSLATALPPPRPVAAVVPSRRRRLPGAVVTVLRWLGTFLLVIWLAGPILWIVVSSTQSESALLVMPPRLSLKLDLVGYSALLASDAWRRAAINSVIVSVGATALALLVAALAAYPLARYRVRGGRVIPALLLGTQLVPPIALAIPVLFVFIRLELRNTLLGLILVDAAFWAPILVWLLRAAIVAVPPELDRAARIDGTSRLGAALRVVVPAAAPAILAAAAIVFIGIWNDFVFTVMLGGRETQTLPRWLGETATPAIHILSARIVLTVAPCIALLVLVRRRIAGLL
jgi:multiple sugar transport system permease protein